MSRKRIYPVTIWLDEKELIKLKDKMALASCNPGINRSEYIRNCALGKDIVVIPGIIDLQNDLRKISNNLGQLTYKVNSGDVSVLGDNLKEIKENLKNILANLSKVAKKI